MRKAITWWDLAEKINQMALDERAKPALTLDDNTGEFIGFTGIVEADEDNPHAYLCQCNHAYKEGDEKV